MKKRIKYLISIFLTIVLLPISIFASEGITLDVDKTDLTTGDEIIVNAMVSGDINSYAIMATFKYDQNVFQKLDETSFDANVNSDIAYNNDTSKFGIINQTGKMVDGSKLFTVRLKVKNNANVGYTNIALVNISSSNGDSKITLPSSSVKVFVSRDAQDGEVIPTNQENDITDDEESELKVFNNTPIIITLCVFSGAILVLCVYMFINRKKFKYGNIYLIGSIVVDVILIGTSIALIVTNYNKKDVNNDGVKDYNDAKDIIKYLIDIESNEEENKNTSESNKVSNTTSKNKNNKNNSNKKPNQDYDTNNDGKVDIEDVGSVTGNVTENSKVDLIEENEENIFYVKNGEVTLKFKAEITPSSAYITKVKIDDIYYDAVLNDGVYIVLVNEYLKPGIRDYVITEVLLSNGREVKTNLKFKRDILRKEPFINNIDLNDQNKSISFELVDEDGAFKEGYYKVLDENKEAIKEGEVLSQTSIENLPIEEGKVYKIEVYGSYDLDSDKEDGENSFTDTLIYTHSFSLGGNYNFKLSDVSITDEIKIGEVPVLSFKSTNGKKAQVDSVSLSNNNGEVINYQTSKVDENIYEAELLEADMTPGKHVVNLEKVHLSTLKTFENTKDYNVKELYYTVLKHAPKVEDFIIQDNKGSKSIDVKFKLKDNDASISKLNVVLVDSIGKIVSTKEYTLEEINTYRESGNTIHLSLSYENNADGFYTVKVLSDYELTDKYKFNNKSIGEGSILTHKDDIYISNIYITNTKNADTKNYYPTKNDKNYQIAVEVFVSDDVKNYAKSRYKNTAYQMVSSITVNGLNYVAAQVSGYKSKIFLNVPSESGVITLNFNRVQLAINNYYNIVNDFYSVEDKTIKIDVLKDAPKIENLKIKDDYEASTATFEFDVVLDKNATDSEDEFKNGTIELNGDVKEIHRGKNTVTFENVEKDKNFDLIFKGSYDLDTDDKDINEITADVNEKVDVELYKVKYGLHNKDIYDNISIDNGFALSEKNNKYFEKNEQVRLYFEISNLDEKLEATPEGVIINDKEYPITKNDEGYNLLMNGSYIAGKKEVTISEIVLSNGKKISLKEPYKFEYEVLKELAEIKDYKYEETENEIKLSFDLSDYDSSLIGKAKLQVTDETGKDIYNDEFKNELSFKKEENVLIYYVNVFADYDRDIDKSESSENYHENVMLLDELISLENNNIELKDITDVNLYKVENENGEETISLIDEVEVNDISEDYKDYFVEIKMNNLPGVRSRIKKVLVEDETLILVLDYTYVSKENSKETQEIKLEFGKIVDGVARNSRHPEDAFKTLLDSLSKGEEVTLKQNYDASVINVEGDTYVQGEFTGTLNGNGFYIKNLTKPLFDTIKGEVKNLILKDVTLSSTGRGALANTVSGGNISNVSVQNVNKQSAGSSENGGLVGTANKNSIIENCGVNGINFSIGGTQQNGGLVGRLENSSVNNSYAIGKISGSWNFNGSFIGNMQNGTVKNSFAKVDISGEISCDFACSYNNQGTYENNISLSSGGNKGFLSGGIKSSKNNYYLNKTKSEIEGVTNITLEEVTDDLFIERASFNQEIWNIKNVSIDNLPNFLYEKESVLNDTSNNDYDESKELLYKNLTRLTPFYDNNKIIEVGKNIDSDLLTNKEIVHILPLDENGGLVTYLTTDNLKKIKTLKIAFKNGEMHEYKVTYKKTYDMVATYKIDKLNLDYNYNHYVINSNSQVVNNLTNYLKSLNYTDNLDILTTNNDSRIYRDFYNDTTRNELKEFVLKYLSNSDYTNTSSDESVNNFIEREVKKDKKIEKALYAYNYFRRFYDLEVDGMKLYDFVLFNMQGFDNSLTATKITNLYFNDPSGANFNTNETNTKYNKVLSGYTKLNTISDLLEYIVTEFSDHNMDEWVRSQFKGILSELKVEGHNEIQYTLWDHFSNEDNNKGLGYRVYNFVLPILTLPETAAYIISSPVQFIIGAQRVYMSDPYDQTQVAAFKEKMETYTTRMQTYYKTAYEILDDKDLFNNLHLFQIDKKITKNEAGVGIQNNPNSTTEPFHKNFNDVVNIWPASQAVNAAAWGEYIEWQVAGVLDSDLATDGTLDVGHVTFKTWSHESAHNIDSRLFLRGYGRRFDAGGEDYADSFFMQSFEKFGIVMNLSINFKDELPIGSNLTPERINSKQEIFSFYNRAFETIYLIDYIEAQAFLQLSKEDQAEVAVQITYPNEEKYGNDDATKNTAYNTTGYNQRTKEDFEEMDLKDINDLYDNQIMLYPGIYKYSSRGPGSYGGEGYNVAHWYQPHNDYGRPDSYAFKWLSYEMLGYAGYDKGFVEYASNKDPIEKYGWKNYKTDLMALQRITEYDSFEEYKKARFKKVEDNLDKVNPIIDVKKYVQEFYDALVTDADEMQTKIDKSIKNYGSEENCINNYWCIRELWSARGLENSSEVRHEIYNKLKNYTNDFSKDEIYMSTYQQDVKDLNVKK